MKVLYGILLSLFVLSSATAQDYNEQINKPIINFDNTNIFWDDVPGYDFYIIYVDSVEVDRIQKGETKSFPRAGLSAGDVVTVQGFQENPKPLATAISSPIVIPDENEEPVIILSEGETVGRWDLYDPEPSEPELPEAILLVNDAGFNSDAIQFVGNTVYNGWEYTFDVPTTKPYINVDLRNTTPGSRMILFVNVNHSGGTMRLRYDTDGNDYNPSAPNISREIPLNVTAFNDGAEHILPIPVQALVEGAGYTYISSYGLRVHSLMTVNGITGSDEGPAVVTIPTITLDNISTDNVINADEDDSAVVITGTTTDVEDSQTVTITVGQQFIYTTTVTSDAWTYSMSSTDATALTEGEHTVRASVSDVAGSEAEDDIQIAHITEEIEPPNTINDLAPISSRGVYDDRIGVAFPGAEGFSATTVGARAFRDAKLVVIDTTDCTEAVDGSTSGKEAWRAKNEAVGGTSNARFVTGTVGGLMDCGSTNGIEGVKGNMTWLGHTFPEGDGVAGSPTPGGFAMGLKNLIPSAANQLIVRALPIYIHDQGPTEHGSAIRNTGSSNAEYHIWDSMQIKHNQDDVILGYMSPGASGEIHNVGMTNSIVTDSDGHSRHCESIGSSVCTRTWDTPDYTHAHGVMCANASLDEFNKGRRAVFNCSLIGNWVNDVSNRSIRLHNTDNAEAIGNYVTNIVDYAFMFSNKGGAKGIPNMDLIARDNLFRAGPNLTTSRGWWFLNNNMDAYVTRNHYITFPEKEFLAYPELDEPNVSFTDNAFHEPRDWMANGGEALGCIGIPHNWITADTLRIKNEVKDDGALFAGKEVGVGPASGNPLLNDTDSGRYWTDQDPDGGGGSAAALPDTTHSYTDIDQDHLPDWWESKNGLPIGDHNALDLIIDEQLVLLEDATDQQLIDYPRVIEVYDNYVARVGCGNATIPTPEAVASYSYGHNFHNWYVGNTTIGNIWDYRVEIPFVAKSDSTIISLKQYWIWEWTQNDGYAKGDGGTIIGTIVSDNNGVPNYTDIHSEIEIFADIDYVNQTSNLADNNKQGSPNKVLPMTPVKALVEDQPYWLVYESKTPDPDNYLGINGFAGRVNYGGGSESPPNWTGSQGNLALGNECRTYKSWYNGSEREYQISDHCNIFELEYADGNYTGYGIIGGRDEEVDQNKITGSNDFIRQPFTLSVANNIKNISISIARLTANPTGNVHIEVRDSDETTVLISDSIPISSIRQQEDPPGTPNSNGDPYSHEWIVFDTTDTVLNPGSYYTYVYVDNSDEVYMYGAQVGTQTYNFDPSVVPYEGITGQITDDGGTTWGDPWFTSLTRTSDVVFGIHFNVGSPRL